MSAYFRTSSTTSWGGRIKASITAVIFGFSMFFGSFVMLYLNEGRVNVSLIAKNAIDISASDAPPANTDQKLVCAKGLFSSDEKIGDEYIYAGEFLVIERTAEMYAWKEKETTTTTEGYDGSETKHKEYSYSRGWEESPQNSRNFKISQEHHNPEKRIASSEKRANKATLGNYSVNMNTVVLPPLEKLNLNTKVVNVHDRLEIVNDSYLYWGFGSYSRPAIGDIRLSYRILSNPVANAIIFGNLDAQNKSIIPHIGMKETTLYRIFATDRATAISTMQGEYKLLIWLFRIGGFFLMWIGLSLLFGPISMLLAIIPFFGKITRAIIGVITFAVSLVLTIITVIISMLLHSPIALIISLIGIIGFVIWYMKFRTARITA
jgi:hypothetical protein